MNCAILVSSINRPDCSRLFPMGVLERTCVSEAYHYTIQELKQLIVVEVAAIDEGLSRRMYENFEKRFKNSLM